VSDSRGMTRRGFVKGAAGTALALGVGLPFSGCGGGGGRRGHGRVTVVGAGLAGLTAAYELSRKGWEVTVLEARDRVGGRCRTFRRELRSGQVAEAGGEYIDAAHDAIRGYAGHFGLELDDLRATDSDELSDAVYYKGRLRDYDKVVDDPVQSELDRFDEQIDRYAKAIDVADPARTGAGLDTRSVADVLDELNLDPDARLLTEANIRGEYTVEPNELSLLFHVVLSALTADAADKDIERYRIRGGNDRLPGALAERLRDSLSLRSPVDGVQDRKSRVVVTSGRDKVEADYCVIATPLPVLRDVELHAELPRPVRNAIAGLQYGDAVKTALQYERRFWSDADWSGDTITDVPVQATWDATGSQKGKGGVLMALTAGHEARAVGAADPRARIHSTAAEVGRMYPKADRSFAGGATIAWGAERWSRGSYAAWAPGQYTRFWPALRRAYGRVYFAGEHTDLYASYMEGAVRSGRRVAEAIEARGT
jgi:monoamine oxidase